MLTLTTYHYLYYHLLYPLGMAHVFGIPVGSVLFYVFYLSMFVTVFVPVIYYFERLTFPDDSQHRSFQATSESRLWICPINSLFLPG